LIEKNSYVEVNYTLQAKLLHEAHFEWYLGLCWVGFKTHFIHIFD